MNNKNTVISRIPKEWEVVRLIDSADYINGYAFSPKEWTDKGLPIIRIQNLNDPEAKFNYFDGEIDEKYIIENGDLLFSWSASIGVYIWNRGKSVLNQHIFKVVPKENVNKLYLYYALYLAIEQLKNKVHGSTMKHFKRNELKTTFIPLPPLEEQKKIAEILSTVDKAIQKVDEAIVKTEKVKKGLMQKLLTKGMGHKEFKDTEIGKIPKDWEVVRLGDVADRMYYGITAKAVEKDTGLHMLRTTDIKEYSVNWESLPFCEITEHRNNLEKYSLKRGDLIIARAGTVGISALVEKDFKNIIFGSYLIKIVLNSKVFPKFLYYFFQTDFYWKHITKAQGSTLKNINLPLLKSIKIPLPPLEEQKKIAEILSTVDKAIQKVDEAIVKTEKVKKGLMQKLLTKGMGHKEFKDTEIGKIPKDWEVVRLGDVAKIIMGQSPPSSTYNDTKEGLPFLQGKAEFGEIFPSTKIYCSKPIKIAESNDILLSVRAPVGDVNIATHKICIGRGLSAIRTMNNKLHYIFLFYYLKFNGKQFEIISTGSTFKAIRKEDIENFLIPLPPLEEQKKIAEILSTVDKKLELQKQRKEKLERIKKGLMNDLLSGKKRVRV